MRVRLPAALVALVGALALSIVTAPAGAVGDEEEFSRFGSVGSGAGQLFVPTGVATNPTTGSVYVADSENDRISKYSAWGEFSEAWGWGVLDGGGEMQTCSTSCQRGVRGSGPGQFSYPAGVSLDFSGNVFVLDYRNLRIQKLSPAGEFVLMLGKEVNKTTGADLCTAASGDECGVGLAGSGPGEFELSTGANRIAVDAAGRIFYGDKGRIQIFDSSGAFESEIPLPGRTVRSLSFDAKDSTLYVAYVGEVNVERLSLTGVLLDTLVVETPLVVTADPLGGAYVVEEAVTGGEVSKEHPRRILEFDSAGEQVGLCCAAEQTASGWEIAINGLGTNAIGDLYVTASSSGEASYVTAYGPAPAPFGSPPPEPPAIAAQYAVSASVTGAILRSQINPHFWQDTTYYVEYGTGQCAEGGCPSKLPVAPTLLTSKVTNKVVTSSPVGLAGLQEATTYNFRFVAASSGGGPVFGIDPDGGGPEEATFEDGLEATFETFPEEDAIPLCPNDPFRKGAAALLPDCRAFEMVSPVDKANGDIVALIDVTGYETRLNQSSVDGEAFTYSSYRAFGGAQGASYTTQYLARRGALGWTSESLAEPRGPGGFYGTRLSGENEYKAFSPDLCSSWLVKEAEPQLTPEAVQGFPNIYRRQNCPKAYEALTTVGPPNVAPQDYVPEPQGYSADGSKAIFRVDDNLTPNAPAQPLKCIEDGEECLSRLYEASAGGLKLVCILPNGTPNPGNCSAGSPPTAAETSFNRTASVKHAISEDGSRIYWSASTEPRLPGRIYLRLNGSSTVEVSGKASSAEAQFWAASADGSKALFSVADQTPPITVLDRNLYGYDLGTETASLIAGKLVGVAGASEDLSRVYFISEEAIGGEGTAGKANLYLRDQGSSVFIATLSSEDARLLHGGRLPSNATAEPVYHAAHVTPDGRRLAFISNQPLTGFDNTDANSGKADSEVFTYAAETSELDCVSCSPVGVRPAGRNVQAQATEGFLWTAAYIPTGTNQLYTPRAISDNGARLFFTSYADLLPRDQNGKADVYEWELAGTSESCKDEADPDFYAANGGCLFLISSGQSPQDSEFVDSSPSGRDVFFSTQESLLVQDPDLVDIYDARIGGGFPPLPIPPLPCEGEACQRPGPAPVFAVPSSEGDHAGNPRVKRRIKCRKGRHRVVRQGRESCVKNKQAKKNKGKGNKSRGPGR